MESGQENPALTDTAAEFLSLLGMKELEHCLFAETLVVVGVGDPPRDKAEGQWWLAAQWAPYKREGEPVRNCILVQARFRGLQDGVPGSSTLKAYVTPQLETLEQEEQECLELRPHPTEKSTHMVSHQHGMTVTKTLQEGEAEPQCQSFSYSQAELRGLLLEGASLLLLRVLARRHTVPPGLVFPAIDTEGRLCTSSYSALGIQRQAVGSAETEVFVMERAMHTSTGVSTVWRSSFLPNGHLVRMMQVGSPTLMLLQDESILSKSGGFELQLPFPKEPLNWEEDIQLCSWFLDRKEELQLSHAAYLQQHPEVRALLSDFLQALLLRQPHDPLSFAAEFFAHQRPIDTPFASTGSASSLPSSPPDHPPANGE
ncbi:ciliogenesis-associated TTC17-interacting protein isoform X1 [Empidonax traillii]|uniref:ciliogenesis-associated TTC17-interacting protein isoform X1 n=1 Tax=Empidonax traillii TaxID=164674 RepID=UPI000FFCF27F|nr:ciliogenesis-associated TTC17-interacting protein isoform X1 [Empidonax traillii]